MNFSIRPMESEDIPQVAEIEREALATTWPPTSFKRELGSKLARYLVAYTRWDEQDTTQATQSGAVPSLGTPQSMVQRVLANFRGMLTPPPEVVHARQDFIAGYVGLWFAVDEAHIISIAVREAYRRMGLGELLLMGTIELAMARHTRCVTLEARITNFPAHALYEKYGFQRKGTRKAYYADNHEDAVIMTTDPIQSPNYQELFQERLEDFNQRRGEAVRTLA